MAVLALCAFVVGCSADVDGSATATQASAESTFDPCTIPDAAIAAAGLNLASKNSLSDDGYNTPGWSVCGWDVAAIEPDYSYSVYFSPTFTLDDVRQNPRNNTFSTVTIDDREALMYQSDIVGPADSCDIAFDTVEGVAIFAVLESARFESNRDLCEAVVEHTQVVATALPPS